MTLEGDSRDEFISWAAAFSIMAVVTGLTVASRLLGVDPFTQVFDLFIVYLPSAVLFVGTLMQMLRRTQN